MAREPHPDDFTKTVDGIGTFTFARRGMRDVFKIRAEYLRLTEGIPGDEDDFLEVFARALADLSVLTVKAPDGWDWERLDVFDADTYSNVLKLWGALGDKEETFRPNRAPLPVPGQGTVGDV